MWCVILYCSSHWERSLKAHIGNARKRQKSRFVFCFIENAEKKIKQNLDTNYSQINPFPTSPIFFSYRTSTSPSFDPTTPSCDPTSWSSVSFSSNLKPFNLWHFRWGLRFRGSIIKFCKSTDLNPGKLIPIRADPFLPFHPIPFLIDPLIQLQGLGSTEPLLQSKPWNTRKKIRGRLLEWCPWWALTFHVEHLKSYN